LALSVHVRAVRDEADKALDSLAAMFAASDALSHQHTMVEHLVRLATLGSALSQTQLVLIELQLTDAQLARLQQQLAATELQATFTRSLIGERALSYQSLQETGAIMLSDDCKSYLEVMTSMIDFSSQPPFVGRQRWQTLVDGYKGLPPAGLPPPKSANVFIALALPSLTASFDAYATASAYRDALLVAIAADRHRLKTGRFPSQLSELTPDYLASVPHDPFDGQPLRFRAEGNDILVYSIGRDGKDDGGQNSPAKSSEPDIVVRVPANKANSK
jgi:hypothetical protein